MQLGSKTADVTNASLCNLSASGSGSIGFAFDHEGAGKNMHGSVATGQVSTLHV